MSPAESEIARFLRDLTDPDEEEITHRHTLKQLCRALKTPEAELLAMELRGEMATNDAKDRRNK